MGKIFGIAMIVLAIWVGMEVYAEGTDRAFGGLFARLGLSEPAPAGATPSESPLDRVRSSAQRARDAQVDRIERQID